MARVGITCAYCHDGIEGRRVRCPRCRTQLHVDCASALSTCSTLGCTGHRMWPYSIDTGAQEPAREALPPERRTDTRALAWVGVGLGLVVLVGLGMTLLLSSLDGDTRYRLSNTLVGLAVGPGIGVAVGCARRIR
jgi:hypothetical protein